MARGIVWSEKKKKKRKKKKEKRKKKKKKKKRKEKEKKEKRKEKKEKEKKKGDDGTEREWGESGCDTPIVSARNDISDEGFFSFFFSFRFFTTFISICSCERRKGSRFKSKVVVKSKGSFSIIV